MCGSGLKAIISGAQAIALGEAEVIVAGGMESMSNAPYLSLNMRQGARMGNVEMKDAMIWDGLWDVYNNQHMGMCAEACAEQFKISRATQDEFALESTNRAIRAQKEGLFKAEIVPVPVPQKKGEPVMVTEDEGPKNAKPEKIATLKPVFKKDGTVTAANASSINDGARRAGADERRAGQGRGPDRARPHRRLRHRGAEAGRVHHRPGRRDQEAARAHQDHRRATSTSGRSTRPSPWSPSPTTSSSSSTRPR